MTNTKKFIVSFGLALFGGFALWAGYRNDDYVWVVGGAFALLLIILIWLRKYFSNNADQKNLAHKGPGNVLKLNPITWTIVRFTAGIISGIVGALLLSTAMAFLLEYLNLENTIPGAAWPIIGLLIGIFVIAPEGGDQTKVPLTRFFGLLTWIGIPLPIVLTTGDYSWIGKRLGFEVSDVVRGPDRGGFTDQNGYIKAGDLPFRVWNSSRSEEEENSIIKAPANNRAQIRGTLTLILQIINPRKTLDSDDPALDIGDRARQEFREFIEKFVDTDILSLVQVTQEVLTGTKLITCFMPSNIAGHKAGAMIRDNGGTAMFALVGKTANEDAVRKKFVAAVLKNGNEDLLKALIKKDKDGKLTINTHDVQITNPIHEVISELGMILKRVTFADFSLSKPVNDAANAASSEADQRITQLASADTIREARHRMLPTKEEVNNPGWETAMILAAAQDDKSGSVKVVLVPGGNKLAAAGVAAATQIGGK